MIPIYIPTVGRSRLNTLDFIHPDLHKHVTLVTNKAGAANLRPIYRKVNIVTSPTTAEPGQKADGLTQGIAPTRQWILDYEMGGKLVMLDDDLRFCVREDRTDPTNWKLRACTYADMATLFSRMEMLLHDYPFVGLSARQGNNRITETLLVAKRMWNVWAVNKAVLKREKIRADATPTMEDFWVQLSLLSRGHETAMICDFVHDQASGSNAAGGCSLFRTGKTQEQSIAILRKAFPDFVDIRPAPENKYGAEYDITFRGKKALDFGRAAKGIL